MSGQLPTSKDLVCIACPMACRLHVAVAADGGIAVSGNRCPRGDAYGREEILAPRRIVTAVVPTGSPDFPCAPVRTDVPVPRESIPRLLALLYGRVTPLPVKEGDVLLGDFEGARVIVTRTLPPDDISSVGEAGAESEGENQVAPGEQPSGAHL